MPQDRIATTLASLRVDLAEIYLHPATSDEFAGHGPGYRHRLEFAGLLSAECKAVVRQVGIRLVNFEQAAAEVRS